MQALARTIRYKYLPPEALPEAPDAKLFPGVPPAGTKATAQPIVKKVPAISMWHTAYRPRCSLRLCQQNYFYKAATQAWIDNHMLLLSALRAVQVEGTTPQLYWQCLGAYAMAGRRLSVEVPPSVVQAGGAVLQIGGWRDTVGSHATSCALISQQPVECIVIPDLAFQLVCGKEGYEI